MPYGVTMFVDPETEDAIRTVWKTIRSRGLSSFMIDSDVRPHLTIATYDELDVDAFLGKYRSFAGELSPVSLNLAMVGAFLRPAGTVFLAPTVTHRLMNIHARFHSFFQDLEHSLSEYSLPGRWFPHFTLAANLAADAIPAVIDSGLKAALPEQSRIEEIGIGEFQHREDRSAYFVAWLYTFKIAKTASD